MSRPKLLPRETDYGVDYLQRRLDREFPLARHIGVRADLRYLRSLEDDNSTNPFGQIDLAPFHYWRTSFGLVLR